jgi:hypothetical protein
MAKNHKSSREVKARIILKFGTITACAAHLRCSRESIRLSSKGKCPRIAKRLQEALQ